MAHRFKLLLVAFMATTIGIACSDDKPKIEDSSKIEEISEKATISGKVTYVKGNAYLASDQSIQQQIAIAADKTIRVEVTNSALFPDMSGVTVYQTTSDAEGKYSIQVPIVEATMAVTIKADSFVGKQRFFDKLESNYPKYVVNDADFTYSAPHTINKGAANVIDIIYEATKK